MSAGTIVVIDDNEAWIESISEVLADEGFEIFSAMNHDQAIELLDSVRPDLIILDVHIPHTSGLRILADYRSRDRTTPILVLSSDERAEIRNQAMCEGASCFLRKPVPTNLLVRAVRRYIHSGVDNRRDYASSYPLPNPSVN